MTFTEPVERHQLRTVAVIGSSDVDTRLIVEGALKSVGVTPFIEGSVVDAVQVFHRDYARAHDVLRAEQRLAGRWISYTESPAQ